MPSVGRRPVPASRWAAFMASFASLAPSGGARAAAPVELDVAAAAVAPARGSSSLGFGLPTLGLALAGSPSPVAPLVGPGAYAAQSAGDWDYLFGGVPARGLLTLGLGYPGLPRFEYHHPLGSSTSIGFAYAIDLGYYSPEGGVDLGMLLGVPVRLGLVDSGRVSLGLRLEPGFGFFFENDFNFAVLAQLGLALGFHLSPVLTLGAGFESPMAIFVDPFIFAFPVLFGPMLEVHPTPNLGFFFDLKLGPFVAVFDRFSDVDLGLKLAVGLAWRI